MTERKQKTQMQTAMSSNSNKSSSQVAMRAQFLNFTNRFSCCQYEYMYIHTSIQLYTCVCFSKTLLCLLAASALLATVCPALSVAADYRAAKGFCEGATSVACCALLSMQLLLLVCFRINSQADSLAAKLARLSTHTYVFGVYKDSMQLAICQRWWHILHKLWVHI